MRYRLNDIVLGIAARLGAVVVMAVMVALVKLCGERGVNTFEIVFFRNAFAFIPLLAYIFATGGPRLLVTRRPLGHLLRAAIGVTGMLCGFTAVAAMPLAEYTAIQFAAPLFITALSAPVLGEKVGPSLWAAVMVGFAGVVVMLRPDPANFIAPAALLALIQALGTAGAMLTIRQLGRTEAGPTIVFYFTLFAALVGAAGLPFVWSTPDAGTLALLVLTGLVGGIGQLLLTAAFRLAPPAVVAPFDYATLLAAGVIGFVVWGELPGWATWAGAPLVIGSGLYIVWRETRTTPRSGA